MPEPSGSPIFNVASTPETSQQGEPPLKISTVKQTLSPCRADMVGVSMLPFRQFAVQPGGDPEPTGQVCAHALLVPSSAMKVRAAAQNDRALEEECRGAIPKQHSSALESFFLICNPPFNLPLAPQHLPQDRALAVAATFEKPTQTTTHRNESLRDIDAIPPKCFTIANRLPHNPSRAPFVFHASVR